MKLKSKEEKFYEELHRIENENWFESGDNSDNGCGHTAKYYTSPDEKVLKIVCSECLTIEERDN
ncbi:MAG TPA: hypothetical protein VK151_14850 [Fluviicola sp.]|nr:hypothetical protein [Fluviicola sp.]